MDSKLSPGSILNFKSSFVPTTIPKLFEPDTFSQLAWKLRDSPRAVGCTSRPFAPSSLAYRSYDACRSTDMDTSTEPGPSTDTTGCGACKMEEEDELTPRGVADLDDEHITQTTHSSCTYQSYTATAATASASSQPPGLGPVARFDVAYPVKASASAVPAMPSQCTNSHPHYLIFGREDGWKEGTGISQNCIHGAALPPSSSPAPATAKAGWSSSLHLSHSHSHSQAPFPVPSDQSASSANMHLGRDMYPDRGTGTGW